MITPATLPADAEARLIAFIKDEFSTDPKLQLQRDTPLVSSGLIDSLNLVSLQVFIEREFNRKIPASQITARSFNTVRQILEVIQRY